MLGMMTVLTALPVLWMEPSGPGRAVTRDDAIGLCATRDPEAVAEMDRMIAEGLPGRCADLTGLWRVTRHIADRCIGTQPGWTEDRKGVRHPATSCRIEAHVVEIARDGATRLALIMASEDEVD